MSLLSEQGFSMLVRILVVVTALPLHELAHGFVAYKLGDPTAKQLGRLTLNPMKHLDPIGAVLILFAGFGYAKPVPVDPRYFKNPRRDMAITAAAGPLANLLLAWMWMLIYKMILLLFHMQGMANAESLVVRIFMILIVTNIGLMIFNLIPFPPLDGSRILDLLLSPHLSKKWHELEHRAGPMLFIGILLLMRWPVFSNVIFGLQKTIFKGLDWITNLMMFLPTVG